MYLLFFLTGLNIGVSAFAIYLAVYGAPVKRKRPEQPDDTLSREENRARAQWESLMNYTGTVRPHTEVDDDA